MEKTGKTYITSITLHQFISHTYTTTQMFQYINRHATGTLERGMAQIRAGINKSFHKLNNYCIQNIALQRDMFRLASNKFKFTSTITNGKYAYEWDDQGEFTVSPTLLKLKNIQLFNDHTSNILNEYNRKLNFKPKIRICQTDKVIYYQRLMVTDYISVFISNNHHYKRSKYHKNRYEIGQFFIIRDDSNEYFFGRLDKIYTSDFENYFGELTLFEKIKIENNGCNVYKETHIVKQLPLKISPRTCEMWQWDNKNYYIRHHVYSCGQRCSHSLRLAVQHLLLL